MLLGVAKQQKKQPLGYFGVWAMQDSNLRPFLRQRNALPAELIALVSVPKYRAGAQNYKCRFSWATVLFAVVRGAMLATCIVLTFAGQHDRQPTEYSTGRFRHPTP